MVSITFLFCALCEFCYLAVSKPKHTRPFLYTLPRDPWGESTRLRDRK